MNKWKGRIIVIPYQFRSVSGSGTRLLDYEARDPVPDPYRTLTPLFGNGAGAHGIGKISGILTKIGKFDIALMYDVSIARLIPIIKLTFFLDI